MDQLIFASLSHTHYWYEVGMLKVPAVYIRAEGDSMLHGTGQGILLVVVCGMYDVLKRVKLPVV